MGNLRIWQTTQIGFHGNPPPRALRGAARGDVFLRYFAPLRPRSCALRRPSAAGWPQPYRRRRNSIGAASYSAAPSGLPRAPPSAVLLVRLTLSRRGPPRTASLSSAACAPVGRRSPPFVARLGLSRGTLRRASPSPSRRLPCVGIRSGTEWESCVILLETLFGRCLISEADANGSLCPGV